MDWALRRSEATLRDPYGLAAFLQRLEQETAPGQKLQGFTFLEDARQMLGYTRQIERALVAAAAAGPLYVGFQTATKVPGETARYRRLRQQGVNARGFGEGAIKSAEPYGLTSWTALPPDHERLENQWFLVSLTPEPIAFVGWEVSGEDRWGRDGITAPGKRFAGFISDDLRAVTAITHYLETVERQQAPGATAAVASVADLLVQLQPPAVLTLVDEGRSPDLAHSLAQTLAGCAQLGAQLYLYDLSSASYLVSPYPDEDVRWHRPLAADTLRMMGRAPLADRIDAARAAGVSASVLLPEDVGFAHLGKRCAALSIGTVVVPTSFTRPSLLRRLQGYTLEKLRAHATVTLVVDDPAGGAWYVPAAAAAVRRVLAPSR